MKLAIRFLEVAVLISALVWAFALGHASGSRSTAAHLYIAADECVTDTCVEAFSAAIGEDVQAK